MSDTTFYKVMFGALAAIAVLWFGEFAANAIADSICTDKLMVAMCAVLVCKLYWKLWHEKGTTVNIFFDCARKGDGAE